MSDFDADAMAHVLVSSRAFRSAVGKWSVGLDEQSNIERQIAAALRAAEARGLELAADIIRSARADYPEDVFPSLPAAAGIRFILDRLLSEIRASSEPPS